MSIKTYKHKNTTVISRYAWDVRKKLKKGTNKDISSVINWNKKTKSIKCDLVIVSNTKRRTMAMSK